MINMTVFRAATLRTFFFAFHAGAKELNPAGILSSVPIENVSINALAPASPYKHLLEPQQNVFTKYKP